MLKALEASPHKSNRAIAKDAGVSEYTARTARKRAALPNAPAQRVGLDGKTYKAKGHGAILHRNTVGDSLYDLERQLELDVRPTDVLPIDQDRPAGRNPKKFRDGFDY